MIYVISLGDSAMVKIGHGENPKNRVTQLQIGSPTPLILQWTHEGGDDLESHLHATFTEYRVRGEWFDLTPIGDVSAAVTAVRKAVEAIGPEMLKAARFRGEGITHPGQPPVQPVRRPLAPVHEQYTAEQVTSWDERFPSSAAQNVRQTADDRDVRLGCIRAWRGQCHRPTGTTCGCL